MWYWVVTMHVPIPADRDGHHPLRPSLSAMNGAKVRGLTDERVIH